VPPVSVELTGKTAWLSVLVKRTVPEYLVATLFAASSAVTVKLNDEPPVAVAGAVTEK